MKRIFFYIILLVIIVASIISSRQSITYAKEHQLDSASVSHVTSPLQTEKDSALTNSDSLIHEDGFSIASIVKGYLALKNAFVKDNDKEAANMGKQLLTILKAIDIKSIPIKKRKDYIEIAEDIQENAEHIGDNAGKIEHQREHFEALSKDIIDLIDLFGSDQKLYQDYCPMYNNGKGGVWISEVKTIKNPYLGSKMSTCGSVKKEY